MFLTKFFSSDTKYTASRLGRVRASLPQEYLFAQLIEKIRNPHPSWETNTVVCEWQGVVCVEDSKVAGIYWRNKGLLGTLQWRCLPPTLADLNLSWNELTGLIPLDELPQGLVKFRIGNNKFYGEQTFHRLPSMLSEFCVNDNDFEGVVDFASLPKDLTYLDLKWNARLRGDLVRSDLPHNLQITFCVFITGTQIQEL